MCMRRWHSSIHSQLAARLGTCVTDTWEWLALWALSRHLTLCSVLPLLKMSGKCKQFKFIFMYLLLFLMGKECDITIIWESMERNRNFPWFSSYETHFLWTSHLCLYLNLGLNLCLCLCLQWRSLRLHLKRCPSPIDAWSSLTRIRTF